MHENLGDGEFNDRDVMLEVGDREVLTPKDCAAVHIYDGASRYNHLRLNIKGDDPAVYFPEERLEFLQWIARLSPVVSAKPEDHIKEMYWERFDGELSEEDEAERAKVMGAKADREIAATDLDEAFSSLLG